MNGNRTMFGEALRKNRLAIGAMLLAAWAGSAQALVRNDNTVGTPLQVPGSVFLLGAGGIAGTGTVVGDGTWVLTAGHVIDANGGTDSEFTVSPMNAGGTATNSVGVTGTAKMWVNSEVDDSPVPPDWGLIKLAKALPGAVPLAPNNPALQDMLDMVGWGDSDPKAGQRQFRHQRGHHAGSGIERRQSHVCPKEHHGLRFRPH